MSHQQYIIKNDRLEASPLASGYYMSVKATELFKLADHVKYFRFTRIDGIRTAVTEKEFLENGYKELKNGL